VLKDGGVLTSNANVTLGASMKDHRINVEGQLIAVPLALAAPYLSEDVSFPGKVNGNYNFAQVGGRQTGKVSLNLPNSYFSILTQSGDQQPFPYENGLFNATIDGDRINIDTSLIFKNRGDLRASAQVTLQKTGSPLINGNLDINIPNIYWAQSYVPYSRGLRGEVVGKVSFSGTVDNPRVVGRVDYRNGYLRLPQVGTELTDITLSIQTNRANEAVITGSMISDGGVIRANGSMSLADIKNWSAKMSLVGENVKFVDTFEAKAYMTPNLQINAGPQEIVITGTVDIPKADINLKDLPELSIDESDDAIVVGEKGASDTINAVKVQPNILVRLGNDVRFKGFGFATRLSGSLRITNSRNTIVTNGSLFIIDGRYQAYGQDLKIDNGRLVFNGPPKNVGVDVKAVREVESGEVGIQLSGTLQRLTSTIFSNPAMEETDALSYLLTGHSLSTATGRETALLMQAVRGFGIDGSDGLIQRLGNSLGLDDLSIVTKEDFKESELQLGKRLGSKLYVRYLVGLFDSAHRLAVDYKINRFLNLEVQVGEEQSVDLIYQIEMN
jgi:translocation and assembly module TamB